MEAAETLSSNPRTLSNLLARLAPPEMLPEKVAHQPQALHVLGMKRLEASGFSGIDAEVDGAIGDPLHGACRRHARRIGQMVAEDHSMEDVLAGKRGHVENMAHLVAAGSYDWGMRPDRAPGNLDFVVHWLIVPGSRRGRFTGQHSLQSTELWQAVS